MAKEKEKLTHDDLWTEEEKILLKSMGKPEEEEVNDDDFPWDEYYKTIDLWF